MASPGSLPQLPPLGKMNMSAILFESVLYGVNCVVFAACVYVLAIRRSRLNKTLLVSSTLLFGLSTSHLVIQWIMLINAYTNPVAAFLPNGVGADIYFATINAPLAIGAAEIYIFNVLGQDMLLIWRLYVVTAHNWKICVLPILIEIAHMICAFWSIALLMNPKTDLFAPSVQAWGKASWSLDLILNTGVTIAIAVILWRAGSTASGLTSSTFDRKPTRRSNTYLATILTIVESGAIYAVATLVVFALNLSGSQAGYIGVSGIIQLATITPLLIIVRVGLGLTHGGHTTQVGSGKETLPSINFTGHSMSSTGPSDTGSYSLNTFSASDLKRGNHSPWQGKGPEVV